MASMMDLLVTEYLAIVEAFKLNPDRIKSQTPLQMMVSRDDLMKQLGRNLFEDPAKKLTIWKDLHWIVAEKGRLSRRYYGADGKRVRGISIDLQVYGALKAIKKGET